MRAAGKAGFPFRRPRSSLARALTSAARRRRSSSRSRASAANRATVRPSRWTPAYLGPRDRRQQRRDTRLGRVRYSGQRRRHGSRSTARTNPPASSCFSVSGDCAKKPGVYEFPMGITVAELLRSRRSGTDAKAVQIGGASGHCVPAVSGSSGPSPTKTCADGRFGHRLRQGAGHARGLAKQFPRVLRTEESCGQCTPCREGNPTLLAGVRDARAKG